MNYENNVENYKFGTTDIVTIVMNGMSHSSWNKWQKTTSMHTHTIHKNDWYTISIAACINAAVPPILAMGGLLSEAASDSDQGGEVRCGMGLKGG